MYKSGQRGVMWLPTFYLLCSSSQVQALGSARWFHGDPASSQDCHCPQSYGTVRAPIHDTNWVQFPAGCIHELTNKTFFWASLPWPSHPFQNPRSNDPSSDPSITYPHLLKDRISQDPHPSSPVFPTHGSISTFFSLNCSVPTTKTSLIPREYFYSDI